MKANFMLFMSLAMIYSLVGGQDKVNLANYTIASVNFRCGNPEGQAVLTIVSFHQFLVINIG